MLYTFRKAAAVQEPADLFAVMGTTTILITLFINAVTWG